MNFQSLTGLRDDVSSTSEMLRRTQLDLAQATQRSLALEAELSGARESLEQQRQTEAAAQERAQQQAEEGEKQLQRVQAQLREQQQACVASAAQVADLQQQLNAEQARVAKLGQVCRAQALVKNYEHENHMK